MNVIKGPSKDEFLDQVKNNCSIRLSVVGVDGNKENLELSVARYTKNPFDEQIIVIKGFVTAIVGTDVEYREFAGYLVFGAPPEHDQGVIELSQ